jgi:hypothetical protein
MVNWVFPFCILLNWVFQDALMVGLQVKLDLVVLEVTWFRASCCVRLIHPTLYCLICVMSSGPTPSGSYVTVGSFEWISAPTLRFCAFYAAHVTPITCRNRLERDNTCEGRSHFLLGFQGRFQDDFRRPPGRTKTPQWMVHDVLYSTEHELTEISMAFVPVQG